MAGTEGTAVFAHEPLLLWIEAPLWQAQLVKIDLLKLLNHKSLIATKATQIHNVTSKNALLLEEFITRGLFSPQG
ncbi:MAG: hypothetical protein ACP8RL_02375 [cyanobacterium endosymbiont of Rhopalodia inflata]